MNRAFERRCRATSLALAGLFGLLALACRRPVPTPGLTVFLGRDVEGVDPHTSGLVLQTQTVLANVYDALVEFDAQMVLRPALAVAWSNPDERTWDFQLREGVTFQTGGELTAQDVVFSVLRARDHPRSVLRAALAGVTDAVVLDRGRVRLKTRGPDAHLIAELSRVYVVSRSFVQRHRGSTLDTSSCGTGSYRLDRRRRGVLADLTAFERCWRGRPPISRVRMLASCGGTEAERRLALLPLRVLYRAEPGGTACRTERGDGLPSSVPGLGIWYLGFDLRDRVSPALGLPAGIAGNPFRDHNVRQAVSLALDRSRLAREAFGGQAWPVGQLVPPLVFGFDRSTQAPPSQLDKARALLQASPFRGGFSVRLDVRELGAEMGPAITRDLAPLGIRVEVATLPDAEFFGRLGRGESSLFVLRFFCWTGDAQDVLDQVVHTPDPVRGLGAFNYSADSEVVPGLDERIDAARRELPANPRLARLQDVMRRVSDAHLTAPLVQAANVIVASPGVSVRPRVDGFVLAREVRVGE